MTPLLSTLTDREEAVLMLIADGYGLREIAERLGITWWTARDHRENARMKLAAPTTTAAVVALVRARG